MSTNVEAKATTMSQDNRPVTRIPTLHDFCPVHRDSQWTLPSSLTLLPSSAAILGTSWKTRLFQVTLKFVICRQKSWSWV